IEKSCAVGVEDTYKMQRVKLYAVLKKGVEDTPRLREELNNYLKNNIAKYALPKEIEFIKELPKTKYGKVDFNKLQENAKTDG
ncbi:MAG: long-chain fatty acid--CoA ligase, partial [Ruminococcus sp.]